MATKKAAGKEAGLPFPTLQLLAPPVRLVAAAVWRTVTRRDVLQYGAAEEFVTSVCDSIPGMLTFRHQGKLTLGLRGRLILELLFRSQDRPDRDSILRHLERFRAPTPSSSAHKPDVKIERTVSCFQELVETLLRDSAERLQFFKEEFPEEYGSNFDQELEKLLWEFLIRLDQLLPVPNLAQMVSWLSDAPPVVEECARAASQPQLLSTILQYQTCLGHRDPTVSLPPKMGDAILTSLSLPPSGKPASTRPPSNQPPSNQPSTSAGWRRSSRMSAAVTGRRMPAAAEAPFIAPVIGLISNKDVPAMISAGKKKAKARAAEDGSKGSNRVKRKQPDDDDGVDGGEEEEEEGAGTEAGERPVGRGASKRGRRTTLKKTNGRRRRGRSRSLSEDGDLNPDCGASPSPTDMSLRVAVSACLLNQPTVVFHRLDTAAFGAANTDANVERARSERRGDDQDNGGEQGGSSDGTPDSRGAPSTVRGASWLAADPCLRAAFSSCLLSQPTVLLRRLDGDAFGAANTDANVERARSERRGVHDDGGEQGGSGNVCTKKNSTESLCSDGKENNHILPGITSSPTITEVHHSDSDADIIGDSEDEATKNLKRRLFVKRYSKTKHNTYVPTLCEFLKPWMARPSLRSPP